MLKLASDSPGRTREAPKHPTKMGKGGGWALGPLFPSGPAQRRNPDHFGSWHTKQSGLGDHFGSWHTKQSGRLFFGRPLLP